MEIFKESKISRKNRYKCFLLLQSVRTFFKLFAVCHLLGKYELEHHLQLLFHNTLYHKHSLQILTLLQGHGY
jgi:hypothetical protein